MNWKYPVIEIIDRDVTAMAAAGCQCLSLTEEAFIRRAERINISLPPDRSAW